jgi:ribosomal protein S18 acetylase RimI-like enzyme
MEITRIENPPAHASKPIEDGVMAYGLSQVDGVEPRKWAFHATEGGTLIGGATGRIHFSQFYLDNLWVSAAHRSTGIGTRLHEAVVQYATEHDCKRILLNTLNRRAVDFYRRLGYRSLAVIEGYVDGFDLHYMALELHPG